MTRLAGILIFSILFSCSVKKRDIEKVQVSGEVKTSNNGFVFLEQLTPDGYLKIDSSKLDAGNQFSLSAPKGIEDIYRINFFGRQKVNLILGSNDILIQADGDRLNGNFMATGSDEIEVISDVNQLAAKHELNSDLISQKLRTAVSRRDSAGFKIWNDSLNILNGSLKEKLEEIIRKENGSLTGLLLIRKNFDIEPNLDFYDEQMPLFREELTGSWHYDQLNTEYQRVKKLALGAVAPDFTLPDPDGKQISLSSLRGRYLYIDFWASWCQPCRMQNPDLVKVYDKYKGPDFEILGVSMDRSRDKWIEAIKKDNLHWIHVSDLKYMDSEMIDLYNIINVPMSFLLDPNGKIIAKNIHAKELGETLGELLE